MRAVLAVSVLCACGGARARAPEPPPAPEAVTGLWELGDGSGIVMQIALVDGMAQIEAWSRATPSEPEVHFVVGDIAWDGSHLHATFNFPPSGTTTRSDLTLVNADRLEGTVSGAYSGKETWLRTVRDTSRAGIPRTSP